MSILSPGLTEPCWEAVQGTWPEEGAGTHQPHLDVGSATYYVTLGSF